MVDEDLDDPDLDDDLGDDEEEEEVQDDPNRSAVVVVVYHVTIVAIGHGLLKKFWPLVQGCVLRIAGSSII